jgi:hypothetical protein
VNRCLPVQLLNAAPLVIGIVLFGLVLLLAIYAWREIALESLEIYGRADQSLLIGLLIISIIVIVFFAALVILSLAGNCTQPSISDGWRTSSIAFAAAFAAFRRV